MRRIISSFIGRSHGKAIWISLFITGLALSFYAFGSGRAANPIVVTSFIDRVKNDGKCTLREAVIAANTDMESGSKHGECIAGNGSDVITFLLPGTYTLTQADYGGEDLSFTGDLDIDGDLTILADQPGVVITAHRYFHDRIIHIHNGEVVISGVVIKKGKADGDGGGIYVTAAGSLSLENSTLTQNTASGRGGAVATSGGTVSIVNSTLSGNTAAGGGGFAALGGTSTLTNLTITGNMVESEGEGAAGGGLLNAGSILYIQNNLIAGNFDTESEVPTLDCKVTGDYSFPTNNNNLIGDNTGCAEVFVNGVNGNLAGTSAAPIDPQLGSMADNGGNTPTHAILASSPARNSGDTASCALADQRGVARPQGPACDIGAFERVNNEPVANGDAYSLHEDSLLVVDAPGVLGNDTDADQDLLFALLDQDPAHGSLTFNQDGSFTYLPDLNYFGADSFTYQASDGFASAPAQVTLTINPVNDPPVAVDDSASTDEDTPVTINLVQNDQDIDGLVVGSSVTIQANPVFGAVNNNGDGTVTYMPGPNFYGSDSFTYLILDNDGLPSSPGVVTVLVIPVNDSPVAAGDAYAVDEDAVLAVPAPGVLENDSDVDGDGLSAVLQDGPDHGALSLSPDGAFSYTPDSNYDGPDSFTYFAFDGSTNSAAPAAVALNVISDGFTEVETTADSGPGSLQAAIERANSNPGLDTIIFEIAGSGPFTIFVDAPLPEISDSLIISGTIGQIVLDGSSAGTGADGLKITAGNSVVRGLTIVNFPGNGILVGQNGDNLITGNTVAFNGGAGVSILNDSQGNTISGNNIHDNGGLSIDLGGDGRTANDRDDLDSGANFVQNFPVLIRATLPGGFLEISGRLNSSPNTAYTLDFYASPACSLFGGGAQTYLGSAPASTDSRGNVYFAVGDLPAAPVGAFVNATATDLAGNTSEYSDCISVGLGNDSWPGAQRLFPGGGASSAVVDDQYLDQPGQSRWYKFTIEPGSRVIATLTNLPANYDLSIYKDIAGAFRDLDSPADLARLGAEFAPDSFSPDSFSPDSFSPDSFSPDSFSPDSFSPDSFSPDSFSPDSFSSDIFSPDSFSPDSFSPDSFSPDSFSPDSFSPDSFSPDSFSPDSFSPDSFSSAQTRSLIGVSAFESTAGEGILVNTWNNSGDFYVRVRGRNGAFSPAAPFHLEIQLLTGSCSAVGPLTVPRSTTPVAGDYQTIILTDPARISGAPAERAALESRLAAFASRSEVAGVVVDVGADARVAEANVQADAYPACPYAKNLVAEAVKEIVDAYRADNPLAYVVIVGDDSVIPFFRYPDNALLANEKNYVPPVRDSSASQASLKLGYVLGQDEYGSLVELSLKSSTLPLPDLAVGRLVETAADATAVLNAYLTTSVGVITPTAQPLVTGYDFLEDAARAVQFELEQGMNQTADELITARDVSPADPLAWSAAQLRAKLLNNRYDLMFLAGHFSASSALAADYQTRLLASEVANASVDMSNVIIFSPGCHTGYNIVNADGIPQVTREPDWAQAFAQKGATLIAGTGYQYGDTDFIEYSERLYLEFSRQLRTGTGPVSIGQALVAAKGKYLADTVQLRGIHEKSFLEATLFGLPMLSVDMPGARLDPDGEASIVSATLPSTANPGLTLGLNTADVNVVPTLVEQTVVLSSVVDLSPQLAFYLAGADGVVTNPAEPALPLEANNVSIPGAVLRGVGFRGGSYIDIPNVLPLTGAPTTEIRGVHTPFISDIFFPIRPWNVNYFGLLQEPSAGATQLAVMPAQFRSGEPGSELGTLRKFSAMDFRLFYSQDTETYAAGSVPALADAPAIVQVTAVPGSDVVDFEIRVVGNPAAGIQEVWVVYTLCDDDEVCSGQWLPVDLSRNTADSTLWEASLPLGDTPAGDIRFMVQAANGVGLVSLATNLGAYYIPGFDSNPADTLLALDPPSVSAAPYGTQATFSAVLTSNGTPVAGERVTFRLGGVSRQAATGPDGRATTSLPLLGLPGLSEVRASFAGTVDYLAAAATIPFEIFRQATILTLDQPASGSPQDTALITATLQDAAGRRLIEKTVFFNVSGPGGDYFEALITDYAGRAVLGSLPFLAGTYSVAAQFSGVVSLPGGETLTLQDERYLSSAATGTLVLNAPIDCSGAYASPTEIWPPNKKFIPVSISGLLDPNGDPLSIVIDSIFQDEPVGTGRHAPDGRGLGDSVAEVRAERDGGGDGRVYHLGFTASDGNGSFCSGEVLVSISHDQGGDPESIDGGACYDSTQRNAPNICVP